jgi:hypothetical protein
MKGHVFVQEDCSKKSHGVQLSGHLDKLSCVLIFCSFRNKKLMHSFLKNVTKQNNLMLMMMKMVFHLLTKHHQLHLIISRVKKITTANLSHMKNPNLNNLIKQIQNKFNTNLRHKTKCHKKTKILMPNVN